MHTLCPQAFHTSSQTQEVLGYPAFCVVVASHLSCLCLALLHPWYPWNLCLLYLYPLFPCLFLLPWNYLCLAGEVVIGLLICVNYYLKSCFSNFM